MKKIKLIYLLIIYFVVNELIIGLFEHYNNILFILLFFFTASTLLYSIYKMFEQDFERFCNIIFWSFFLLLIPHLLTELSVQKTHFEKLFNFFDKYQTIETRIDDSYTEKLYPVQGIYGIETESEIEYTHKLIKQGVFAINENSNKLVDDFKTKYKVVITNNYFFKTLPYVYGFETEIKTIETIFLPITFIIEFIIKSIPMAIFILILDLVFESFFNKSILMIFETD